MSRRVLITGVTGMLGRELALCLRRRGYTVYGAARRPLDRWQDGLEWLPIVCDLTDDADAARAVRLSRPELIFHLAAAQASATRSPSAHELLEVNVCGTLRLLNAAAEAAPGARLVIASTGAVYGPNAGPRQRWREEAPLWPASPYAASKAAMELAARSLGDSLGIELVVARLFNLIGISPRSDSAPAHFARQLAAMMAEGRPRPLATGNLDAVRDYLDSRDAARALALLGELEGPDPVYNICSGRGVRLQWVARQLWRLSGLPEPEAPAGTAAPGGAGRAGTAQAGAGRVGTAQAGAGRAGTAQAGPDRAGFAQAGAGRVAADRLVGDPRRLRAATGWAPEVSLTRSLERLLHYWRSQVAAGGSEEEDAP